MKIAIVTDIHHGPLSHAKDPTWNALPALSRFVNRAIEDQADVLLDLGDRISDTSRVTDRQFLQEVAETLSAFPGKRVHLLGNHDINNLTVADNEEILQQSMASTVHDLGNLRLIAWQPGVFSVDSSLGKAFQQVDRPEIDWLVKALLEDDRPAIIATHVPLSGHSQIGNHYFENRPHRSTYPNAAEIRSAVEGAGKAAIWLAGHVHWNTITNVRNVQHVTVQSMSERFTTIPATAEAHATLKISDGQFTIEVFGNDPFYARLPFRTSKDQPWLQPTTII